MRHHAPRRSRLTSVLTASAATALTTLPALATGLATAPVAAAGDDPSARVLQLTNAARAEAGCQPLKRDTRLDKAAQGYARSMAASGNFSHTGTDGSDFADRIRAAGHRSPGGENIAQGQSSADEVVADWMDSPGHRKNIENCSFRTLGLGLAGDDHYWVQDFGR